jgi:pimeloyl-ACP methyl ester carboxylesterase
MTLALDNYRAAQVHELDIDGNPLRYRVFGDGPAVVLVHGWPLHGATYRELIEALRPHYCCYVPDLPGAGDTPWWPEIRDTMTSYTALLRRFVDALHLERFALIAHDSGGGAARLLAAELGQRVSCLILQNTEVPDHLAFQLRLFKWVSASPRLGGAFMRLLCTRGMRQSRLGFGGCFGDRSLVEGEFFAACIRPLLTSVEGHRSILNAIDLSWTTRLSAAHARITAPIHLFWGGADTYFPLQHARRMMSEFANPGELRVVPEARLYVHEEAAGELAQFSLPLLAAVFSQVNVPSNAGPPAPQAVKTKRALP